MKHIKFLSFVVLLASLMLSACGGLGAAAVTSAGSVINGLPQTKSEPASAAAPVVASGAPAIADAAGLQSAYEAIYQQVNPSVVTIEISTRVVNTGFSRSNGQIMPSAEGSGFVWDTAGHIVTNNHVVDNADKIQVIFADGSTYDAKLTGTDPNTDLAVIQVTDAPKDLLVPVTVGDSTQVKVGELVVAIGNPYGLSNTMTTGIVSAIARSIQSRAQNGASGLDTPPSFAIPDVIQTDAAINPGNSGGVLVNMNGEVIGVPSQIESTSGANSGIGFAIPATIVQQVVPQLIKDGKAAHAYLGISGTTVNAEVISALKLKDGQTGILVATVVKDGPAGKAGLKGTELDDNGNPTTAGDIITAINGQTVTRFEDLVSYLYANTQPGQKVTLNVLRGSKEISIDVTLGTQPTQ